ncbi:MAG: PspC domain-containing protein [Bacteriovoracaceae bacterium]|nr:PspC domain-containing protein [Bacteriovoracaceae bacterium]
MHYELRNLNRWSRSLSEGVIGGVLSGLARGLGVDVTLVRLVWLISILLFGSGIFLYLFLWVLLPREDKIQEYEKAKVLGVCHRIGQSYGHELAVVRILFTASFFFSFGVTFLAYILLYFLLPENHTRRHYRAF